MEENSNPFRRAGLALMVVGLIDIGFMTYCILNKINYSSSFNIFAVIAGIFLIRKGVKTARVVRWFSAFMIVGFVGMLLTIPLSIPLGLIKAHLILNTWLTISTVILGILLIAFLIWIQLQLSTPESLRVLGEAGYNSGTPKSAYIAGLFFVVLLVGLAGTITRGESGQKAIELAKQEVGPGFNFHVSSISFSNDSGQARVTAYNDSEIRDVQVKW